MGAILRFGMLALVGAYITIQGPMIYPHAESAFSRYLQARGVEREHAQWERDCESGRKPFYKCTFFSDNSDDAVKLKTLARRDLQSALDNLNPF